MHPSRWLETAFGSESRVGILRLLVADPPRARTEREIAHAIGMSPNAVNHTIRRLRNEDLVEVEDLGNAHAVRLRANDLLVATLRRVFATETDMWVATLNAIKQATPTDAACYLYGSSAAGAARAASDVDLLVIARDRERANEVAYAIQLKVHKLVPARIHVIALSASDASKRLRQADSVVRGAIERGRRVSERGFEELRA